ncbi:TIGR03084 family metal-binding protein [Humibacter sp.]|uniref:TIGR03084 family metal-binding protein n=1 Tax=Humibacter sp. TaxID=1940291 RepID=UPI002C47BE3A|nr:TIGR03084 family metal-binding protein [Humibacter sp.]HVX09191.1 TIGR03084 family metal-binding protein [Humibacter sp.]
MAADLASLLADLEAESSDLEVRIVRLEPSQWLQPTPAAGWTIADHVAHLAYFDDAARLAVTEPDRFRVRAGLLAARGDDFSDRIAALYRGAEARALLQWFRSARRDLVSTYGGCDPRRRVPWYGPDMSVASSITARIMETWAHGQDVADTLAQAREPTSRLRHVAHIGVGALAFSFAVNGRPVPERPVRIELVGPDGDIWTWGSATATDSVVGGALDFCLVVTQRRNLADTALVVTGAVAREWLSIAQAFAGPPGPGRPPGRAAVNDGGAVE